MRADSHNSTHDAAPYSWGRLAGIVTRRTTDLLSVAILCGGILWATWNLTSLADPEAIAPDPAAEVASTALAETDSPIVRRIIRGDESAAWKALIEDCGRVLQAPPPMFDQGSSNQSVPASGQWQVVESVEGTNCELRQSGQLPRTIFGVDLAETPAAVRCWGRIRPVAEGEWSVAVLRLSPPISQD